MKDVLSKDELETLSRAAKESFNEVIRAALLKQALSGAQPLKHAEVMERDGHRVDCRHGVDRPPLSSLLRPDGLAAQLIPALQRALGNDAHVVALGQIVAMAEEGWVELLGDRLDGDPDSGTDECGGAQRWHADGPPGSFGGAAGDALTLFIPLVELRATNGPTQYQLGSHAEEGASATAAQLPTSDERERMATTLLVPAGSAIAFDFKLWHRGLTNTEQADRPMLYAVIGRPITSADGRLMLPMLDGGRTSLFGGAEVAPIHTSFRLGDEHAADEQAGESSETSVFESELADLARWVATTPAPSRRSSRKRNSRAL